MFAELMSWVKQMVCLVIFLTMALQILPDQRYVKYIRFFAGLILIAALMKPLISLLGANGWEEEIILQIDEQNAADMDWSGMEEVQAEVYEEFASRLTEDIAE
ncbi:MAG: stage III sporulation protein AF [Clostridiales bacterium]|nr:stage III sporulation protein AF [Clostridiales bacterium]